MSEKHIGQYYGKNNLSNRSFRVLDFVSFNNKIWKITSISSSGLLALKNMTSFVPSSIIVAPSQVTHMRKLMKIIKT